MRLGSALGSVEMPGINKQTDLIESLILLCQKVELLYLWLRNIVERAAKIGLV